MRVSKRLAFGVALAAALVAVSCGPTGRTGAPVSRRDWAEVLPVDPAKGLYYDRRTGQHFDHQAFILDSFSRFSEGLCPVSRRADGKKGYIDRGGRVVLPYEYLRAERFSDGRAWVAVPEGKGIIDPKGRWVVEPGRYEDLDVFSEGRCAFRKGERWGFLDVDARVAIPPVYREVHRLALRFREGLCLVWDDSGSRVCIDRSGRVAVRLPGNVSRAFPFSGGLIRVAVDVGPSDENPLDWGRSKPRTLYGYVGRDGRMAIEPRFGTAGDFREGLAPVTMTEDGTFAVTRERIGRWEPDPDFPEPPPRWGFIDKKGQVAIPMVYEKAGHFSEGLAAVRQNGLWGYVDHAGRMVIGAAFEDAEEFEGGIAQVVVGEHIAYIDRHGRVLVRTDMGGAKF